MQLRTDSNGSERLVLDASQVTRTFDVVTDGSGNFGAMQVVCDGSALAQCAAVKAGSTAAVAGDPALNQPDRIHPNAEGVGRIAARLAPLVERLLDKAGAR